MSKKTLILSFSVLAVLPTLKIFEITSQEKNIEFKSNQPQLILENALKPIKNSIEQVYKNYAPMFSQINNSQDAFLLYQKIVNNQKQNIQLAYENKVESAWYWFGYWKWFTTWEGFINVMREIPDVAIGGYSDWEQIKPALYASLLTYLGTTGSIPVVGWIAAGAASVLATSILGSIAGHRLWESPKREKGIVMSFYLVGYTGSWEQ